MLTGRSLCFYLMCRKLCVDVADTSLFLLVVSFRKPSVLAVVSCNFFMICWFRGNYRVCVWWKRHRSFSAPGEFGRYAVASVASPANKERRAGRTMVFLLC